MPAHAADNAARAEALHAVLTDRFWLPRQRLFRVAEGRRLTLFGPWHHWWQSQALAVLLDRAERTGDARTRHQADALLEGMRARGGGRLTNDFYDDVGWLALALLRMPDHADDLAVLMATLRRGEMPEGGIAWSTGHPEFRNVAAAGPAAITALRLAGRTGDEALSTWGLALVRWIEDRLVSGDGQVADGFRVHPDGSTSTDPDRYSYNHGLVVGAELAALQTTGDRRHLDRAQLVANAALRQLSDAVTGVWVSEGPHDRALFRGILARHLADLALAGGDEVIAQAVRTQAAAVWRSSQGGPVGHLWPRPTTGRVELSGHVGGLLVLEAAARLG